MKKLFLLVLFLTLYSVVSIFAYTTVNSSSAHTLNMSIDIPETKLTGKEYRDGNTYSSIILPNAGKLMVGKPDVPGLANWILIPNGTNVSISTFPGIPLIFENVDLAPVQQDPFDNVDSPLPPFEKDKAVYSRNADYPGTFAEVESTKHKRGQECTILWIYPYQYNPVERTLTVYPDLEVSVNFSGIIKPIPANLINDRLIESLKSFAINSEEILQAEQSLNKTKSNRLERTDGCELLIISDPLYMTAANTLGDWKTKRGIYTTVVSTSTTGSSVSSIENYIDNAYDNWSPAPSYFLFIGDDEDIPAQDVTSTPSDFYYADRQNPPDWVADFGYGRLSVDTSAQADSLVARIIRYERTPTTNSDYYDDILNAACFQDGELPSELPDQIANRRFCKTSEDVRNYLATQGYSSQREYVAYNRVNNDIIYPRWWNDTSQTFTYIFENDGAGGIEIPSSLQKPTYPWDGNTAGISSAYNNGVFFSLFRAHGSISGWGDPDFSSTNVNALTNGEDRPIVWSITCQSGWFDGTECFAEHWIRHTTGGSVGILAASRNSYSGKNDRLIWGMMNAIWPNFDTYCSFSYGSSTPIYRMGDVKNYGMDYMSTHYSVANRQETIRLFHWFGDPTMQMWTSEPSQLTNAYATTDVNIGTSSMTVKVEPAVSGMLVCAYTDNADEIFATATTNASGYAYLTFNNSLLVEPLVQVTVTKHNYLPYEFNAGTNTWEGSYNRYWSQYRNWSLNHVPTAGENVLIPDVALTDPMYIDFEDAVCNNLTIASGVELQIEDQTLTVNGDLTVSGHINMLETNAIINVMGDVDWESGSELTTTVNGVYMNVYGDWDFSVGANVNPTQGYIDFRGTTDSWIRGYSSSSSFYRLRNYKSGGAKATFSNLCTEDIVINGLVYTTPSSILESMSSHDIIMRGSFNYYGTCDFTQASNTGSVIFDGVTQNINNYSSGSCIFNNVVFSSSTSATLYSTHNEGITVAGDLTIEQGVFNPANYTVTVGGDWTNTVGPAGFTEGTGRVIFNGPGPDMQYIHTDETFSTLENNTAQAIRINTNITVECDSYDWTSGNVSVVAGTFIANDLFQSGLYGNWYALTGSEIYLNQDPGQYVDVFSEIIHIHGNGLIKVTGGNDESYWCGSNPLTLEIDTGILDFDGPGITIFNSNPLTEAITDGTIKTSGWFNCFRPDFNPTAGEIELYGETDANINMVEGSNFYDVRINKATADIIASKLIDPGNNEFDNASSHKRRTAPEKTDSGRIKIDREGNVIELTRSETVTATSELHINGNLQIDNGTFDLAGFNVDVLSDVKNYGSLTVAVGDTLDIGNDMYLYNGSAVDLSGVILLGTRPLYYGDAIHYTGSTFNQTDGDYYVETIKLYDGSQFNGTDGTTHVYVNGSSSTNNIEIDDPDSYFHYFSVDSGANAAMYSCDYDLYVSVTTNLFAPLDINGFTLSTLYMNVKESGDLIINTNGVVDVRGNGPYMQSTGALTMTTGSVLNSADNIQFQTGSIENVSGGEIFLEGSFTNADEIFTPTGGSVTFDGSSASSIIGTTAFYDLNINKTGSTVTTNAAFSMNDLVINSGILDPSGFDLEVFGNWTNNAGDAGFVEGTQTVTFDGTGDVSINGNETFYNLTLDKVSSADWLTPNGNLTIGNDLVINPGALYSGANTISVSGNTTVNSGGVLYMQANSTLALDNASNLNVNSGGWLYVRGSSGNQATVTHQSTGFYGFRINSGGTIAAEYAIFEWMNGSGIYLLPGANLHGSFTFNHCIFRNGHDAPSALLALNNSSVFTSTGASFYDNSSGLTGYNVWKYFDTGEATFNDVGGDFWGEGHEYDTYNRVHWNGVVLPPIDDLTIQYNAGPPEEIELIWTYPVSVNHFNIYRSTDPYNFSGATVFTTSSVGYSEPASGTKYFYYVTADSGTDSDISGKKETLGKIGISADAGK